MTYERPVVLATYKVEELMTEAAVCTCYRPIGTEAQAIKDRGGWLGSSESSSPINMSSASSNPQERG